MIIRTANSVYTVDTNNKTVSGGIFTETGIDGIGLKSIPTPEIGKNCIIITEMGLVKTSAVMSFNAEGRV